MSGAAAVFDGRPGLSPRREQHPGRARISASATPPGKIETDVRHNNVRHNKKMRSAVSYVHPRDEILQPIHRISRYRMTPPSGGNLSIRDDNGDVWITPAGIDKGTLRREDIICVHADGTVKGPH